MSSADVNQIRKQQAAEKKAKAAQLAAASESKAEEKKDAKKKPKFGADESKPKFVNQTPKGQLKDFSVPMQDAYHPLEVESAWDSYWEAQSIYKPEENSDAEKFVMVIPPPNVTGTLHIGHALTNSIEDCMARWHRMSGKSVLWVPGADHAGIATQVVVEKQLTKNEGKTRHDLGREKFIEKVWEAVAANGNRIQEQTRRIGASVDWSRYAFTMDDTRYKAVTEAFVRMYDDGLIYRDNRLVSWSCALRTAISSIEVDYIDIDGSTMLKVPGYDQKVEFGVLHHFAYKFADEEGKATDEEIVVATTRIETMLGDVAVAVHPDDERYKKFHGRMLVHPFIADRKIRLITDPVLVDMSFGSGAVKITPAHDPNDFECGKRHNLQFINIFDEQGIINSNGGQFAGQGRFTAREKVVEQLKALGLYREKTPNKMSLGICSRSKDIVEPVIRPQWYVKCAGSEMVKQAIDAARSGELEFIPANFDKTWYSWLENIQDWCISRQLWWGHRIPAFYATVQSSSEAKEAQEDMNRWFIGRNEDEARARAAVEFRKRGLIGSGAEEEKRIILRQDDDVLDTWFSSGLFPFSTMGWPDNTSDFSKFYPNALLETGHDILFFWVARMVLMGLQLTGKLPFAKVFLHAMVRDKFGRKMSKSLGNVIDPLDVIEGISLDALHAKLLLGNLDPSEVQTAKEGQKRDFPDGISECGADALRFGLLAYSSLNSRDINLDIQRVVAYRQFCNKLWQATRFALLNFPADYVPPVSFDQTHQFVQQHGGLPEKWLLARLHATVKSINTALTNSQFAEACQIIYAFWYDDICDVYLEAIKPVCKQQEQKEEGSFSASFIITPERRQSALMTLYTALDQGLRMLHPMMPFLTEELFHRLPGYQHVVQRLVEAAKVAPANEQERALKRATGSIAVQVYPKPAHTQIFDNPTAEAHMHTIQEISHAARSSRASLGLAKKRVDMFILCSTPAIHQVVSSNLLDVATLSLALTVKALNTQAGEQAPEGCIVSVVNPELELHIPLQGLVDPGAELLKLEKQQTKLQEMIKQQEEKVNSPGFDKMPAEVTKKMKEKLAADKEELSKVDASIVKFGKLLSPEQRKTFLASKLTDRQQALEKCSKELEKISKGQPEDRTKIPKKTLKLMEELEAEKARLISEVESTEKQIAESQ